MAAAKPSILLIPAILLTLTPVFSFNTSLAFTGGAGETDTPRPAPSLSFHGDVESAHAEVQNDGRAMNWSLVVCKFVWTSSDLPPTKLLPPNDMPIIFFTLGIIVVAILTVRRYRKLEMARQERAMARQERAMARQERAMARLEQLRMSNDLISAPGYIPYRELKRATENFHAKYKLGEGGFGRVYRGWPLKSRNMAVAIKWNRISDQSMQGRTEFEAEVKILSQVHHRNLLGIIGWCYEDGNLAVVYELMSNGSLDRKLYGPSLTTLDWPTRYNIVLGVASAIHYLHDCCNQCILHRDIKPSNILLDSEYVPKLGDFGLARLMENGRTSLETNTIASTRGYIAPEISRQGRYTKESDVYSFGVVLLEIAFGRRAVTQEGLLADYAWGLYKYSGQKRLLDFADTRLDGAFHRKQMKAVMMVGLWCTHPNPDQRLGIRDASDKLLLNVSLPRRLPSRV